MQLKYNISENTLTLVLEGNYIAFNNEKQKSELLSALENNKLKKIVVNGKDLGRWDSTLVVILFEMETIARNKSIPFNLSGTPKGLNQLLTLAFAVEKRAPNPQKEIISSVEEIGNWGVGIYNSFIKGIRFLGSSLASIGRYFSSKAVVRKVDFLFALEDCSYKALPIVTLISFMVGLILAFVGAMQLKNFGAQIYVASLVTIGMTRIMGAIMTGVIMAGRTGASYAATIGTMQVNEEIDALRTMGIGATDFLVLPRLLALIITMPLLTMWADFMGMLGGGFVGILMLDIPFHKYWELSIRSISLNHFLVGIFHGFIFGIVIAVCGCYYGIYCGRNAESVGIATTKAVVSGIVWMVVMTGIITIICQELGI